MLRLLVGAFLVLHGLVHLLYLGQSRRLFELQAGMAWPDGSWAFSRLMGEGAVRLLAGGAVALAALGFAAGGVALIARLAWWRPLVVGAALFSSALYLLFWDGTLRDLDGQGAVALLINLAVLAAVLVFDWPDF